MEKLIVKMTRNLAILFAFLGCSCCSTVLYSPQNAKIRNEIAQAEYFARQGHYKQAISRYEQTLKESSKNPWQDKVFFNIGRLYALNKNPEKDFARSLLYFQKLKEEFPKSQYNADIQVWIGLLENLVSFESELKARNAEYTENKFSSEQEIARLKTAIEALQLQLKKIKEIDIQSEKKAKGIK